jgi:hypothetical protein
MNDSRKSLIFAAAIVLLSVLTAAIGTPQQNVSSGGSVSIVQGGNTAVVTAAGAQKVDGSAVTQPVSGTFWQATQPVSGTFWQATQPVSGPLTDAQLRASAVPVSGSFSSTPLTACGSTNYDSGIITIPNSTTVLTSTATCVSTVILINLTGTQQTCTVTDGQGTPANLIPPSFDLWPKTDAVFNRYGVKALSGIKWSCANASAVAGIVRGTQ